VVPELATNVAAAVAVVGWVTGTTPKKASSCEPKVGSPNSKTTWLSVRNWKETLPVAVEFRPATNEFGESNNGAVCEPTTSKSPLAKVKLELYAPERYIASLDTRTAYSPFEDSSIACPGWPNPVFAPPFKRIDPPLVFAFIASRLE